MPRGRHRLNRSMPAQVAIVVWFSGDWARRMADCCPSSRRCARCCGAAPKPRFSPKAATLMRERMEALLDQSPARALGAALGDVLAQLGPFAEIRSRWRRRLRRGGTDKDSAYGRQRHTVRQTGPIHQLSQLSRSRKAVAGPGARDAGGSASSRTSEPRARSPTGVFTSRCTLRNCMWWPTYRNAPCARYFVQHLGESVGLSAACGSATQRGN